MSELILQRRDRAGYLEKYPVYINRKQVARIGFGETLKLELEPGRYQLHCGGLFGTDAETWFDIKEHRKAYFLSAERLSLKERPFPKYYRCLFTETTPMQIKGEEEQNDLKAQQSTALIYAFGFIALLSAAGAWLFWQSMVNEESILFYLGIFAMILIPWAYRGVLISQLKKTD